MLLLQVTKFSFSLRLRISRSAMYLPFFFTSCCNSCRNKNAHLKWNKKLSIPWSNFRNFLKFSHTFRSTTERRTFYKSNLKFMHFCLSSSSLMCTVNVEHSVESNLHRKKNSKCAGIFFNIFRALFFFLWISCCSSSFLLERR
jgi:hypothetical protein